ncbi:glycoside hydrolase family protein [Couchioplanes azureus]|uniref:hypothetical protein n=1 Tax=Couchioplanes caeruleus TaxID=56438 RepID=UPI001670C1F5|nr:hypothetical protein [Couchioplanes caeruleus]GGQ52323.1 hypothetical protein GCM10010166_21620 [Couchioplanes caeruleus subsp. azureus]
MASSTPSPAITRDSPRWYEEYHAEAVSPWVFPPPGEDSVREPLWTTSSHGVEFSAVPGGDAVWIVARFPSGAGTALRVAYCPRGRLAVVEARRTPSGVRLRIDAALGAFRTDVDLAGDDHPLLHVTTTLRPSVPTTVPYWPRDLVVLGEGSAGRVYARQEGLRTGCVHFSITRPDTGTVFYFQNLTALNDYAQQTGTSLADVVGGTWPELGLALPASAGGALRPGHDTVISDAYLAFSPLVPEDDVAMAEQFLTATAEIVVALPRRSPAYVHWPDLAERSLRDLSESPLCSMELRGNRFLNAYVGDAETPPESMVQLAVLLPLLEYAEWRREDIPLAGDLLAGLGRFFDAEAGVMGRWLMSEKDRLDASEPHKKPGTMDSWYLYHSLLNLARLARRGDEPARTLFLDSLDRAVEIAHRFAYRWPVLFNLHTLDVEVALSGDGESGESDVAALYAHVMLEAFELTGDRRYVTEAAAAADMLEGLGMSMFYQANVTLFGAAALLRLAQITGEDRFRRLTHVAMASAVNNAWLWECDYGHARHYPTFFALFPLRGAPYIAILEAIESFSAAQHYLRLYAGDMPKWMTVLLPEFCRGLLTRAGSYYPPNLPEAVVSDRPRVGAIDPQLWVPLEDLHDGWEQAGQVGQEVYGAGAAFALVPRQYHRIVHAGLLVFTDYPVADFAHTGEREARLRVIGDPRFPCRLRLIPAGPAPLPEVTVSVAGSPGTLPGTVTPEGHLDFELRGDQTAVIHWRPNEGQHT